jgi:GTP cyclohydrolase I
MSVDRPRAEAAIREFLLALGHEMPSVAETAERVTAAYCDELLSGYSVDLSRLILEGSEETSGSTDPVALDEISLATVCPHHLLVAQGTAFVAYVPGTRILGLGTIARLVNAVSRRLILQEQIASDVVHALMEQAGAKGAFCRIVLDHACLQARGALQSQARATTWSGAGEFEDPGNLERVLGRSLRKGGLE